MQCSNEITITIIIMGRKFRGVGSHLTQSPLGWGLPPYQVASCYMQRYCSRSTTIEMGRKLGRGALPPFLGSIEWGSHLTQSRLGWGLPQSIPSGILIHPAIWLQQIWAKNWGLHPLWGRGAGSPPNTMWPGPRPTCMPSFILICPTIWPQCTKVTDRKDTQTTDW